MQIPTLVATVEGCQARAFSNFGSNICDQQVHEHLPRMPHYAPALAQCLLVGHEGSGIATGRLLFALGLLVLRCMVTQLEMPVQVEISGGTPALRCDAEDTERACFHLKRDIAPRSSLKPVQMRLGQQGM